jgi:hypothetical protein
MGTTHVLGYGLDAWPLRNRCCDHMYQEHVNNPRDTFFIHPIRIYCTVWLYQYLV